jgi:hypothetical protein
MNKKVIPAVSAVAYSLPFFAWVYPALWEWMAMPIDDELPAARIIMLLIFGAASFLAVGIGLQLASEAFEKDD